MFDWAAGSAGRSTRRTWVASCCAGRRGRRRYRASNTGARMQAPGASDRGVGMRLGRGLLASVMAVVLLGVCASGAWAAGLTAYVAGL